MTTPADPASNRPPPAEPPQGAAPYQSIAAMREIHGELLRRRREAGLGATAMLGPRRTDSVASELIADVAEFIRRGQVTGTILDGEDERVAAQSLLTYWANILQRLGHAIEDGVLSDFDPLIAPELPDSACPYLGLDAFREGDHDHFFGRDAMVEEMVARLAFEPMLLVVGPSGSGKSSLVRAGLAPALKGGAITGSERWRYLEPIVPGAEPFVALARALRPSETRPQSLQTARALCERPGALPELLGGPASPPAVLLIDQFEELFTLVEAEPERAAFVSAILSLADAPQPAHRVILTMRSDFEPLAAALPGLDVRLERIKLPVLPLGAAELRQAIEAPAQAVGLRFEPGVVDLLVQDIVGEPAGLPLLQFTLLKLWDARERNRITLAAHDKVGGGRQALARSADAFYDQLIPEDQVTVKRVLLRMVRPGEGLEVTSSRIRLESLYALGEDPGRVERVVQKLIDERLLRVTPGDTQSSPQAEVAHEALVRNWPRLVGWLEDEKVAIATRRRLEQRAQEWQRLGGGRDGLLDAAQLREAERWVASPAAIYLGYDAAVTRLIVASSEALREAEAEREATRQRELEQARALAAEQQARAEAQAARAVAERRSRNVARILSAVMAALAVGALFLFFRAQSLAVSESQQRATAASLAGTAEILRQTAEGRSQVESQLRVTAEAAVTAEAIKAAEAAANARAARAGELAAQAQASLATAPQRSLLLAVESVNATGAPQPVAREALYAAVAHTDGEGLGTHQGAISAAAATADGALVATAGDDGVYLWDPAVERAVPPGQRLADLGEPSRLTALSPDGRWLAVAGAQGVLLYPLSGGQAGAPSEVFSGADVTALGISPPGPNGTWLLVGDAGGRVSGLQLGANAPGAAQTLAGASDASGAVRALTFTPDGAFALSGGDDRVARLWDLRATPNRSRLFRRLDARSAPISTLAVSAAGDWTAIGSTDGGIHLWGLDPTGFTSGPAVKTGHQAPITALAFSPDGRWLLSGSTDRNARLWPETGFTATGAEAIVLTGHSRPIVAAAFSPDSRHAVTGGADSELLVWRMDDPSAAALRLYGHDGPVTAVLAAGGRLLSAAADGQLRRWPFPPAPAADRTAEIEAREIEEVKALACRIAGRNLTSAELERFFPEDPARPPTCGG